MSILPNWREMSKAEDGISHEVMRISSRFPIKTTGHDNNVNIRVKYHASFKLHNVYSVINFVLSQQFFAKNMISQRINVFL